MAPETVDTRAIAALHQQVYAALQAGPAPWFTRILRRPEEVADFTDYGRRKMPALMCGADNGYLALTRRQIATIEAANRTGGTVSASGGLAPGLVARNRTAAEIRYEAAGNPPSSRPDSAVANCCPGLEVDFRAAWRRVFVGIVLREYDNLVLECLPSAWGGTPARLSGRRLLRVVLPDGREVPFTTEILGPATSDPTGQIVLTTAENPNGRAPLEWSNALAPILDGYQGRTVRCDFSEAISDFPNEEEIPQQALGADNIVSVDLEVRHFFEHGTGLIAEALAAAGELTQGLCSPWQNDYRECSCYYWASARPDFVNVELAPSGFSRGDNWFQKRRTGDYVADDYRDSRLVLYDDLFLGWERLLKFQIGGRDAPDEDGS